MEKQNKRKRVVEYHRSSNIPCNLTLEEQCDSLRKVLDGDTVVTEWYRSGNEVVSRKIAGKKHIEGRMKVRGR